MLQYSNAVFVQSAKTLRRAQRWRKIVFLRHLCAFRFLHKNSYSLCQNKRSLNQNSYFSPIWGKTSWSRHSIFGKTSRSWVKHQNIIFFCAGERARLRIMDCAKFCAAQPVKPLLWLKASSGTKKNWYDLRYNLLYIKLYIKSCKKPLGKFDFPRFFLHNLRYNFEVWFQGRLEYTPSCCHQKLATTSTRVLSAPSPLIMPSATQLPCVMSSAPLLSSCHPPPDRLTVISPLPPCLALSNPPLSLCCPPPSRFSIWLLCVGLAEMGRGRWSNVLHCPPLPSHHVIRCLLALRLVVPPLACLIFWLLCVGWWVSPLEIDTIPDEFLPLAPVPSIFFYSVSKAFLRYNFTSRHEIVPKNHTSFFWWQNQPKINFCAWHP